ncbi:MAG: hypothetical protein V3V12_05140 [Gammaproteobacteria bacterium]
MNKVLLKNILGTSLVLTLCSGTARAVTTTYTDQAAFLAALSGTANTLDFDSTAASTLIPTGSALGGITFHYDFGGTSMAVTDGNQFGGGGPFETTSGSQFLGTDGSDLLLDDDDFSMDFAASNAIGFSIITAEIPGTSFFDDDIQLSAGNTIALLDVDAIQQTLNDGSLVFFLGIIDDSAPFTSANVFTPNSSGSFLYNIDDIVTTSAVPVPAAFWLFGSGLTGLIAFSKRTRQTRLVEKSVGAASAAKNNVTGHRG